MDDAPTTANQVTVRDLDLLRDAEVVATAAVDPNLAAVHAHLRARRTRRAAAGMARSLAGRRDVIPGAGGAGPATDAPAPDDRPATAAAATAEAGKQGPGRILAIDHHGPTVRIFRIGRPAGFTFRAGQYLKAGVPGGSREDFSIASAPHEAHLELAVELRPGGTVTPALFGLHEGDAVALSDAAKGKLQLDRSAGHHVLIATVTGIAPVRSMVLDALRTGTRAAFTILHGASYATELPYRDELAQLATTDNRVRYIPTISRPDEAANRSWTGTTGRVDPLARLVAGDLDPATTHVYAVGNAGMIKAVLRDLGGAGFPVSTESYGS
jgi:NAD(P)H-flavin reductase